ncbi:anthranilate synthase component I family protein [Candidatus Magnetobacterium casense]|uniref:anthranilate synthase component I family protein n=1 Tax=Candidatus Magnetobacterium casense TaxID=1455061 RepID=UPI00058FE862|nr:anthranilate synthase component I family protein [Candidatus Magnetobacterium casensis]
MKTIYPDKPAFLAAVTNGSIPALYRELTYRRPSLYYAALRQKNSFILESVRGSVNTARYSFIGFEPYMTVKAKGSLVEVQKDGKRSLSSKDPLTKLRELIGGYKQRISDTLPPFQGGAVGLLSYDLVRCIEDIPNTAIDDLNIPLLHFFMIDRLIAVDHVREMAWLIVCPGIRQDGPVFNAAKIDWSRQYDETADFINNMASFLEGKLSDVASTDTIKPAPECHRTIEIIHETTKERYMGMVGRTLEYIGAGDIFQANLSQRLSARIGDTDPWQIYTLLSRVNPSPFACFLDFGDYQIVSSSPERLVRVMAESDGVLVVDTRPIAGTRPRGKDVGEDEAQRSALLLNEKERAEHIMLIDLERNDLGRVCRYGTVGVDELMITEDYSHVIHIVSNVRGVLNSGKDCIDVIRAVFPGGTITGVPKVRCMQIIDELEPVARGPYTGSVGYIGFAQNMDINIIIRSFVVKDGYAYVQAGAGIVADSDPEREYYETLSKAEALIKTLKILYTGGSL